MGTYDATLPDAGGAHHIPLKAIVAYFVFLCATTAIRSCEFGIVTSMVLEIKSSLDFSYGVQGVLAASSDYGLVPGAVFAVCLFEFMPARKIMVAAYFWITAIMLVCCIFPGTALLIITRSVAGFCWAFAAVHYPAWINSHGPEDKRTMWMAIYNAFLLVGIGAGYVLGAYTTRFFLNDLYSWVSLYACDAILMLVCTVVSVFFDTKLIQVLDLGTTTSTTSGSAEIGESVALLNKGRGCAQLTGCISVLKSPIYLLNLVVSAIIAACGALILFYALDILEALEIRGPSGHTAVLVVMAAAPLPGNLIGAACLNRMGGYQNIGASFGLMAVSASLSIMFVVILALAAFHKSIPVFLVCFFLFIFFSAMPTAANNGIAVSAVPRDASIHGSAIQFTVQNMAKLIVPSVGGTIFNHVGLLPGIMGTLLVVVFIALFASFVGLFLARKTA